MNDDFLRTSIENAVDDVEPTDRLGAIRARTTSRTRGRRGWYAAGGSLLVAAAAAVVVVAVTGRPSSTVADPAERPDQVAQPVEVRAFYVGPGPSGADAPAEVLYRSIETGDSVLDVLMSAPSDPDYRTRWPEGSLLSYKVIDADSIHVSVSAEAPLDDDLALQQLAFTLHEMERSDAVVIVTQDDAGTNAPTREVERADDLSVLSHMSIDTPAEGVLIARAAGKLDVRGRGNSFEASGSCFLVDETGEAVGERGLAQMKGWTEPRLYPFELELDLTDVPAGAYTLTCITDDPTGGTEGRGADSDTRTVIVE